VLTPPSRATLSILADDDPKPHACTTVTVIATLAQLQHAIAQFVAATPWWGNSCDRSRSRRPAIFRRNHNPRSVTTLLVASLLVITVPARPRLALRSNRCPSRAANDRSDCSTAPAVQRST
jgi:hypothetical protein